MISLQHVSKKFGERQAVDNISFDIKDGETVALLGTSGCGKTTTLRMINRLTEADSGSIIVNGQSNKELPLEELRRGIGYVLQHNGLFPHYTIEENIAIVPGLFKWQAHKIKKRITELLAQLHLPENILAQYPAALSGGQQQRVGLARALAADPPILLMDEPFGALDAVTRAEITKDFRRLDILQSKTILLVTHDIQEAFALADRIILMHEGKIMQQGTAATLLFSPANNFVKDFFAQNRLQSELSAVTVAEAAVFFAEGNNGNGQLVNVDHAQSLWELLEQQNGNNKANEINAASVLQALENWKKNFNE